MQGMGGFEFKSRLNAHTRLMTVPVVFLVPYKQGKLFRTVMPKEQHLLKPFGDLELLDLLDRLLGTTTRWCSARARHARLSKRRHVGQDPRRTLHDRHGQERAGRFPEAHVEVEDRP
jgi:FixJ family two-component response regulator